VAHDSWINRGGLRNAIGESCCGDGDCFSVAAHPVRGGYVIEDSREYVPEHEVLPSPDGAYWRCKRHDGTRRCFFAPPPSS
jgi:hypothetical protein